jgi:hypothetical protein
VSVPADGDGFYGEKEEQKRIYLAGVQRLRQQELSYNREFCRGHAEIAAEEVLQKRAQTYGSQDTKKVKIKGGRTLVL